MTGFSDILDFAEKLSAELKRWRSVTSWEPVSDPPAEPPRPEHWRLEWIDPDPNAPPIPETVSLSDARLLIADKMRAYAHEKRPGRLLLVTAQPGVGKTHAAVSLAQELAGEGLRVFYAMPTHDHYHTLSQLDHFNPDLWYHWLSFHATSPVTGNPMCMREHAFKAWTTKGYPAKELCRMLCPMHIENCEFRQQRKVITPTIAGTHDHVSLGLSVSNFDVAIVDELPMRAFHRPRRVPRTGIQADGIGPVKELGMFLANFPLGPGKVLAGKDLLDFIGPYLVDVYAQFEDYQSAIPEIPWLKDEGDVKKAPYWYLPDLLFLLAPEYAAWEAGQTEWLERVIITTNDLILLTRAFPWGDLPVRTIALDATGNSAAYQQLFGHKGNEFVGRRVEQVAPNVERVGHVYQIAYRLNGISTMTTDTGFKDENNNKVRVLAEDGQEALDICKAIIEEKGYTNPGAVTFKGAVREYEKVFGAGNVLHFFGQRGSNDLVGVDALFVVGCPQPSDVAIMDLVKILYSERVRPFHLYDGMPVPVRSEVKRRYNLFNAEGQQRARHVSGFWNDGDLETIAAVYREDELVQAIHRGRPISRPCDVWLLTSIPTNEPLTAIYDKPGDVFNSPMPDWKAWRKIEALVPAWYEQGREIDAEMLEAEGMVKAETAWRYELVSAIVDRFPALYTTGKAIPRGKTGTGRPPKAAIPNKSPKSPWPVQPSTPY